MLRFLIWALRRVNASSKGLLRHYLAYRSHRLFLPEGTILLHPENIRLGKNFSLSPFCQLICQDPENGSELTIGDRVSLNFGVHINADCGGKISIGNDVLIGPGTMIRAANHRFSQTDRPIRDQGHEAHRIVIENDVWIGGNVVILPGVIIGNGTVIGAGSIVTKSIPPFSVVVGNPATVIRSRLSRFDQDLRNPE